METRQLIEIFRNEWEKARRKKVPNVDLFFAAVEAGETDINKIGVAARQLASELGDNVRLEAKIYGLVLWIENAKAVPTCGIKR